MRDVVLVIVHADETGVERHARAVDDGGVLGHGCDPDNDGRDRLVVDEDRMRSFAGAPVPSMTRTLVMASLNQPPFPPGKSNSCLMPVSTNCP